MHGRTPTEAAALIRAAGRPNARMMIDALHLFRFDRTVAEAAAVAPLVGRLQLCDGPAVSAEDQLKEAISFRLPPGEARSRCGSCWPSRPPMSWWGWRFRWTDFATPA